MRGIDESRQPTQDERRKKARELRLEEVREHRADHEDNQHRRRNSSRPREQQAEATQNLKDADDRSSARGITPLHEPVVPSRCRRTAQLRHADQDKRNGQEDGACPQRCAGKLNHGAHRTIKETLIQLTNTQFVLSNHHSRTIPQCGLRRDGLQDLAGRLRRKGFRDGADLRRL